MFYVYGTPATFVQDGQPHIDVIFLRYEKNVVAKFYTLTRIRFCPPGATLVLTMFNISNLFRTAIVLFDRHSMLS